VVAASAATTLGGMGVQISPSILNADFTDLAGEVARIAPAADWVHVDVMDNHFVPNLTLGAPVVERLARVSELPIDAHLMITDADRWAPAYAEAGARSVTFHVEAATAPVKLARDLRGRGVRAGMALRPATAVEPYAELLPELDMLLLMTVEPGFGGQKFLDLVLPKVRTARELAKGRDLDLWIQVDGGVDDDTIVRCAEAGADVFVAGSAVYGSDDPAGTVRRLRARAESASASSWWAAGTAD
jgi:ribulose-phosphate 3-epimerase